MFETKKVSLRLGKMEGKWIRCTGVNPADKGQIAERAIDYMASLDLQPEDAWLTALISWMNGMPWPESKVMMATALIEFLNTYEGKITLSEPTVAGARIAAESITDSYVNPDPPEPGTGI